MSWSWRRQHGRRTARRDDRVGRVRRRTDWVWSRSSRRVAPSCRRCSPGSPCRAEIPPCRSAVLAVKPVDAAAAARAAVGRRCDTAAVDRRRRPARDAGGRAGPKRRGRSGRCRTRRRSSGKGAAAIAAGGAADAADVDWAASILGAVGTVDVLPESSIDVFTGVAGSGPAYLFLVAEALTTRRSPRASNDPMAERVVRQLAARFGRPARPRARPGPPPSAGDVAGWNDRRRHRGARGAQAFAACCTTRWRRRPRAVANWADTPLTHRRVDTILNYLHVFSTCHFSHRLSSSIVRHVETRSPATASSADRAGAIGGLAPALVAFSGHVAFRDRTASRVGLRLRRSQSGR